MRLRRRDRAREDDAAAVAADTALRLAVLLQAGIAPVRAWEHLAELGDAIAAGVRDGVAAGLAPAEAIARAGSVSVEPVRDDSARVWRDVAAAWRVATTVGAPLAESLRGIAAALRDTQEARDEVRVALAEPAATARLMSWLPLIGAGLGLALGFDTLSVLATTPAGAACLVAGVALMAVAHRWTSAMVARARASAAVPGLGADVLAIALSAGASIERAQTLAAESLGPGVAEHQRAVLDLSARVGVPAVELLRASASLERHRARTDARLRAGRLATGLLAPLGVCTLPAFLLLGVAPMLLSVMGAVALPPGLPEAVP